MGDKSPGRRPRGPRIAHPSPRTLHLQRRRKYTNDPHAAKDLTQEALLRIVTKLSTFQGKSSFRTWAYRIVANQFLQTKRRPMEDHWKGFDDFADQLNAIPSPDLSPEEEAKVHMGLTAAVKPLAEELKYYVEEGQRLSVPQQQFPTVASRKPLLAWPRSVPFAGGKLQSVGAAVKSWAQWLPEANFPKLCLYVSPGVAIKEKDVKIIRETFKHTKMIDLGKGLHFIQEDYPHEIGSAIAEWYQRIS